MEQNTERIILIKRDYAQYHLINTIAFSVA